jgi:hypothetical protein
MQRIRVWAEFNDNPGARLGLRRQVIGKYNDQEAADLAMMEFEVRNPGVSFEQELIDESEPPK